jgi:hypothetical protein
MSSSFMECYTRRRRRKGKIMHNWDSAGHLSSSRRYIMVSSRVTIVLNLLMHGLMKTQSVLMGRERDSERERRSLSLPNVYSTSYLRKLFKSPSKFKIETTVPLRLNLSRHGISCLHSKDHPYIFYRIHFAAALPPHIHVFAVRRRMCNAALLG